jgi:hypothetical protein
MSILRLKNGTKAAENPRRIRHRYLILPKYETRLFVFLLPAAALKAF